MGIVDVCAQLLLGYNEVDAIPGRDYKQYRPCLFCDELSILDI